MMKKKLNIVFTLIVFFHFVGCGFSQNTSISPEIRREILKRIDSGIYESIIIGIINKGTEEILQFNQKETQQDEVLTVSSLFEASNLKPIWVSLQLADMLNKDILTLNQNVNEILPKEYRFKKKKDICLGNLALFNSGISLIENGDDYKICLNRNDIFKKVQFVTFDYEIGNSFDLSSFQSDLLSSLLLEKMGLPCEIYFNEELFPLLSLRNSILVNGRVVDEKKLISGSTIETGKIYTSCEDILKILQIENGQMKKEFANQLSSLQKYQQETRFKSTAISPGWFVYQYNSNEFFVQTSDDENLAVFASFCPSEQIALIILAKTKNSLIDLGWSILLPNSCQLYQKISQMDEIRTLGICGEYVNDLDELISIVKQGSKLIAYFNGKEAYPLFQQIKLSYAPPVPGIIFRFIEDDDKVVKLIIEGYSEQIYSKIK